MWGICERKRKRGRKAERIAGRFVMHRYVMASGGRVDAGVVLLYSSS